MNEHLKVAVEETVKHFLPGCERTVRGSSFERFRERHPKWQGNLGKPFGMIKEAQALFLWMRQPDGNIHEIEVTRRVGLTSSEIRLFDSFGSTLEGFLTASERRSARTAVSMASLNGLGDTLVARYLGPHKGSTFYSPLLILNELKSLALKRYEGAPCSSGVVYAADSDLFLSSYDRKVYQFEPLGSGIEFTIAFFSDPATYRYVDGRNAFYLVDNRRKVKGVLRIRRPGAFSLPDRACLSHLVALGMGSEAGGGTRSFAAFVGRNNDIHVATRGSLSFRWENLRWTMVDRRIFPRLLEEAGLSSTNAVSLVSVLLAASELRMGALVLIPDDPQSLPSNAGEISSSEVANALQVSIQGRHIGPLVDSGAALGVLTSDGLTIISNVGEFIDAGKIIDLSRESVRQDAGGGRTQAALAASEYGLAIKVSEDGPITIFRKGEALAKFSA